MEPIGGYFELALPRRRFRHDEALLLNTGRACMTLVLEARRPRHVHVPAYTCDAVLEPMRRLGIGHSFLAVNAALELASPPEPAADEMILVNDYFGLKGAYCAALAERWGDRLIVDCSQAWYAEPPAGSHCFYSPRKFFGVPDGGCLYSPEMRSPDLEEDLSAERAQHLVRRMEQGPEAGYADFRRGEAALAGQPPRRMSRLTRRLLGLVDHESARKARIDNFERLDAALAGANLFHWRGGAGPGPMVYPYRPPAGAAELRRRLLEKRIFVATYWPNVLEWCEAGSVEHALAAETLPLPVDQRYGPAEMDRLIETVLLD